MPVRKGQAEWQGDLLKGKGTLGTETGTLKGVPYNFSSRFESGKGTNPEELLAAAHAACYSMALSAGLSGKGYKVNSIRTEDTVHIDKQGDGFAITTIEISTEASVDGIDDATFQKFAEETKIGCPVSKALTGPRMVLKARLTK
ncbi:MAG TPA: OsmC family peroxiredoxin [Spirochaetia bacterium]|nr:OsmC family peroxiredoxin [Spirochaetia bacterium]